LELTNRSGAPIELDSESEHRYILGMRVDALTLPRASERIVSWAERGESRYVCVASVHMVMEAFDSEPFRRIVNQADLVTPDGRPLLWTLDGLGVRSADQVRGTDLTVSVLEHAARRGVPVGLYGGTPELLDSFSEIARARHPGIRIVSRIAPPFRPLTAEEDELFTDELMNSGARIILVGIGCPKQERWMAAHKGRLPAVMIGVGAAFDFYTGRMRQAPRWMQKSGLEWTFRLASDPGRLWKRYARHNPRFLALCAMQLGRMPEATWHPARRRHRSVG